MSSAATRFDASAAALEFLSSGGDLQQLSRNTAQIDSQVRAAVSEQWRPLLSSAQTLAEIRSRLSSILDSTSNLSSLVSTLQRDLKEPVQALSSRRQQLSSLLTVAAALRSLQRFLQLIPKLRTQLSSPQEIHVGTAALAELFELSQQTQLSRIIIVSRELPVLTSLRRALVERAQAFLENEFFSANRSKPPQPTQDFTLADIPNVSSSIMVLFLLGELSSSLANLAKKLNSPPRSPWVHRLGQHLHVAILKLSEDGSNPTLQYSRASWTNRQFADWSAQQSEESLYADLTSTVAQISAALKQRLQPGDPIT